MKYVRECPMCHREIELRNFDGELCQECEGAMEKIRGVV